LGGLLGERRGTRTKITAGSKGIRDGICFDPVRRLPQPLGQMDLCRGSNRITSKDLAKGTERSQFLRSVQVWSTAVVDLAESDNLTVMVKDVSGVKVRFARQQQAHNQCVRPSPAPEFAAWSQVGYLIPNSDPIRPCMSAKPWIFLRYQKESKRGRVLIHHPVSSDAYTSAWVARNQAERRRCGFSQRYPEWLSRPVQIPNHRDNPVRRVLLQPEFRYSV